MNFIRLTSADDMYFRELLELYEISFPQHEQRIFDDQIRVLDNSAYHCEVILEDDEFVGLICYWKTKRFSYIEHFAIHPNRRGDNLGSRCLQEFIEVNEIVILEIDPPIDPISIRRKNFYMRLGFQENKYHHEHPPYKEQYKPHELVIMSFPRIITECEYAEFNEFLKNTIMNSNR
ncbi:GNAT family N-acetyltransferase [Paenibacillus alvei]|uniref:GNAT family N-acetyltransferase n=1 Tax=Paenibacillus alvei TaxID=44250 RepID=UPI0018CF7C76|nr:GNAT family N-acetyltransferase [Paenibacillus alvei]MBG9736213.1 hypothetical protein [Paenibacillus alvei]MBG9745912.1 hypothetical protein [Paenibacillus alvei]MCY9582685.1 GNAT family N-acetyltransferase [Paenibacillus alvei]MCY9587969.1 GNAT family N-acetyltransferase [Paenibacillus alvei]